MSSELGIPRRRLGGYRKADVEQIVADRDAMMHHAEERMRAAYARIGELDRALQAVTAERDRRQAEVAAAHDVRAERDRLVAERSELLREATDIASERDRLRAEIDSMLTEGRERDRELGELRARVQQLSTAHEEQTRALAAAREDAVATHLSKELSDIITAANQSAKQMTDRAKEESERLLDEANRRWSEVSADVERFVAWRDRVEPAIRELQERVGDVRSRVEVLGHATREALVSIEDAASSLEGGMTLLAEGIARPHVAPMPAAGEPAPARVSPESTDFPSTVEVVEPAAAPYDEPRPSNDAVPFDEPPPSDDAAPYDEPPPSNDAVPFDEPPPSNDAVPFDEPPSSDEGARQDEMSSPEGLTDDEEWDDAPMAAWGGASLAPNVFAHDPSSTEDRLLSW